MSQRFLLGLIFVLAAFLRLYHLSTFPYGFHIDEVKAGWNAFSLLTTGRDDHGHVLPLYYDSFGDQRPTGIFYLIIPSLLAFGRTIFAVRFPSAILGALTIFPLFLIVRFFSPKSFWLPLISALFLALNPWHITVSRATSEVVISLFFAVWGLYYSLKQTTKPSLKFLFFSTLFFLISYLFYHSIRVLAPFLVFLIFFFNQNRHLLVNFVFIGIISLVFLLHPAARGRMAQVSIRSDFQVVYETQKMPSEEGPGHVILARFYHNKLAAYLKRFLEEYVAYFSPQYLVGTLARPIRYQTPYFGLITYLELFFLCLSLATLYRHKSMIVFWLFLIVAPLPSALTIEDTPNLHRSLFMVIPLSVLASFGLYQIAKYKKTFLIYFFGLYLLNISYFLHLYFRHSVFGLSAYYRNGGMVEMVSSILPQSSSYDYIAFTNYPDNPYPWLAFFSDTSASVFNSQYQTSLTFPHAHQFQNFVFSSEKCPSLSLSAQFSNKKTLFIDAEGCGTDSKLIPVNLKLLEIIQRPDNSPAFTLWQNL